MSEQTGFQLIIATFDDETTAAQAVNRLLLTFRGDAANMPAAAYVGKDAGGQLTIRETADLGGKQGAAAGALAGGLVGLLSRRRGMFSSAALGALLGGVAARKLDTGIPDPRLEAIGQTLDAASGAAVAVVSDSAVDQLLGMVKGLGAHVQAEPFARETDFMKQLQAGNIAGAATILANEAEGRLAGATAMAVERAEALSGQARGMLAEKEPETLTDEEEIEIRIDPDAAATMVSTDTQMTSSIPVRPDDDMKPAPAPQPAQVAGADAVPDNDAGGLARSDIDESAAGVADIWPPAV